MKLSDTQATILSKAARHSHRLAGPPSSLAPAARESVRKSLLGKALIEQCNSATGDCAIAWTVGAHSTSYRITEAGLQASEAARREAAQKPAIEAQRTSATSEHDEIHETVAIAKAVPDPKFPVGSSSNGSAAMASVATPVSGLQAASSTDASISAPPLGCTAQAVTHARHRPVLREAARSLVEAWDTDDKAAVAACMDVLRAAVSNRAAVSSPASNPPSRKGTKQESILAMLRRPEGTSIARVAEATGWQPHTVRGFFAGLKTRLGLVVTAERVRQAEAGHDGSEGRLTIYRLGEVQQ